MSQKRKNREEEESAVRTSTPRTIGHEMVKRWWFLTAIPRHIHKYKRELISGNHRQCYAVRLSLT